MWFESEENTFQVFLFLQVQMGNCAFPPTMEITWCSKSLQREQCCGAMVPKGWWSPFPCQDQLNRRDQQRQRKMVSKQVGHLKPREPQSPTSTAQNLNGLFMLKNLQGQLKWNNSARNGPKFLLTDVRIHWQLLQRLDCNCCGRGWNNHLYSHWAT